MSIATKRGDKGQTSLAGGIRVSKSHLRVEAYGTVDELNSCLGFARAICTDAELKQTVKGIQRELFQVGAALATPTERQKNHSPVTTEMVEALTTHVHSLEAAEGILADWSLPGENESGAAFDMARTICRRAERHVVRLTESGEAVDPQILAYLNRLSDLIWLFGRLVEQRAGVNTSLRKLNSKSGPRWSRAW